MKIFLLLSATIFLIIISCSTGYLVNLNESTNFPEGRNLFVSKCNGCHNYHDPAEFTITRWDSIMVPMQKKARITDIQKTKILQWLSEKIKLGKNHLKN